MHIDRIELYLVENEFISPWRTAYGADAFNRVLITRMVSGDKEGWSEASPLPGPTYSAEYAAGCFDVCKEFFAPALVGKDIESARELNRVLAPFKGNPFAKGGIEMAWWTLEADIQGKTLGDLIGAKPGEVEIGQGFGICDTYDELIEKIGGALEEGYTRVKLKVAHGWDIEMLEAVRSVYPNARLHVDCNSSYEPNEMEHLVKFDRFNLAMIEQPFRVGDIYSTAKLQKRIDTPICLDEAVSEVWHAEQAAEIGACKYVNIKPARVGGIQNSLDINRICEDAGIGCWIGGMMESDIGKAITVELAALSNMVYPHDITPSKENYITTFTEETLEYSSPCHFHTSSRVGTPIVPDLGKMKEFTKAVAVIE